MRDIVSFFTESSTACARRWKLSPQNWWGVAFFVLVSLLGAAFMVFLPFVSRPGSAPPGLVAAACILGMFQIIIIPLSLWIARFEIITDQQGLSWRGFGRRRSVLWEEVTDYYELQLQRTTLVVETKAGTFQPKSYVDDKARLQELKELIQHNATRAKGKEWAVKGVREVDEWPQTFIYNSRDTRILKWIVLGVFPPLWIAWLIVALGPRIAGIRETFA